MRHRAPTDRLRRAWLGVAVLLPALALAAVPTAASAAVSPDPPALSGPAAA